MRINSINLANNYNRPSFSSWLRVVKKTDKEKPSNEILYRNDTIWFRFGISEAVDTIVKHYKNDKHVNTYIYGCSNGSEPTSMYVYMTAKYGGKTAAKFTPFNAMDVDTLAITKAQSGHMPMEYFEFERVVEYTYGKFNNFFENYKPFSTDKNFKRKFNHSEVSLDGGSECGICFKLKNNHAEKIKYSVNDILEDYKNINPKEPSLVIARNFLPYLNRDDIHKLLSGLNSQMKEGSLLVLGDYDFCAIDKEEDFSKFLKDELKHSGFKPKNELGYIFVKS